MDQLGSIAVGEEIKITITRTRAHTNTHCELPQVNRCSHGLSQMLRTIRQLPFLLSTLGGLGDIHNLHTLTHTEHHPGLFSNLTGYFSGTYSRLMTGQVCTMISVIHHRCDREKLLFHFWPRRVHPAFRLLLLCWQSPVCTALSWFLPSSQGTTVCDRGTLITGLGNKARRDGHVGPGGHASTGRKGV